MAITIQQYPIGGQYITMAHNPVEYVVSSNNTAQPNFKYIADLSWTSGTTSVRYIQGADPTNGRCRFDLSSVLRNVVTYDPPVDALNDFYDCKNSYSTLTIKFGEQYGPTSAITNYVNLQSDGMYIWNACLPIDRWWNGASPTNAYKIQNATKKFLTDYPFRVQNNGIKLCYNDRHFLYFLQDGITDDVYQVKIELYKNNAIWNTIYWDCPAAINKAKNVVRIGVGAKNLQLSGSELNYFSSQSPCIDEDVEYYSVELLDDKANQLTESLFFSINCECTWETPYRLCFLNKLGGYDFFNFNWNSKKSSSYEKSYFKRKAWNWNNSNEYAYNSHGRGKVQYSTIGTDRLQLTSGWITEEESTWLEELISSPDVYIIDNTTGQLTAVTVTDTQYDYKTLEYDQLFNLTVNLEFAHNRYRQSL
jgi:hypothetical protein